MMIHSKLLFALLAVVMTVCSGCHGEELPAELQPEGEPPVQTEVAQPEEPVPIIKTSTATVAATGDVLMHYPVIKTGLDSATGEYNFDSIFTYFDDYVSAADYAVANLETTLCGLNNGYKYQGYPRFNCPDGIVGSMQRAGFDMLLTANNHTYDTGETGFLRTLSVIDGSGLARLGTNADGSEPKYTIQDVKGIKIGMICYTYETEDDDLVHKSLNGIRLTEKASGLINTFSYQRLEEFYAELEGHLKAMKAEGAQASILFLHWGNEYQTRENDYQRAMAQAVCDLGVDVIVGGHPHVVQPVELLTSQTEAEHRTVCLYSMGNAVSNQRIEQIPSAGGYTEDGVLFRVTFARYSDGTILLESADVLPTWVNLTTGVESGKKAYEIIPLDRSITDWKNAFTLTEEEYAEAEKSYERTMSIVGEGLEKVRQTLDSQRTPEQ